MVLTIRLRPSRYLPLIFGSMNSENTTTHPNSEDDLDDPYIHIVSTEEFVETVEQATQEASNTGLVPNKD